jgi:hypothetical protein
VVATDRLVGVGVAVGWMVETGEVLTDGLVVAVGVTVG